MQWEKWVVGRGVPAVVGCEKYDFHKLPSPRWYFRCVWQVLVITPLMTILIKILLRDFIWVPVLTSSSSNKCKGCNLVWLSSPALSCTTIRKNHSFLYFTVAVPPCVKCDKDTIYCARSNKRKRIKLNMLILLPLINSLNGLLIETFKDCNWVVRPGNTVAWVFSCPIFS